MSRERVVWLLALLALLLGAWWLSLNTEWVDDTQPRPLQGEAKRNPVYALEQLLRRLGVQASHHESLAQLPPPRARLVMLSPDWQLHPGLSERLRHWVAQGGHLVLSESADWQDGALADWLPMKVHKLPLAKASAMSAASAAALEERTEDVRAVGSTALGSTPPLWEGVERLEACAMGYSGESLRAEPGHTASWSLALAKRVDVARYISSAPIQQGLRVPLGQGSVTAIRAGFPFFGSASALRCDNPLLLAALVQAEPGAEVWIYLHEEREALLPWLWQQAWVVIVLGLLALAAWLWRAAVRFGPQQAGASRPRRSMAEQVQGLAAFLNHGGCDALLAAQQRALHEAALRSLPHLPSLRHPTRLNLAERAEVLADATGLPAEVLTEALSVQFTTRAALPRLLQVLETARRRLLTPESLRP
jgi:hypothetical protein